MSSSGPTWEVVFPSGSGSGSGSASGNGGDDLIIGRQWSNYRVIKKIGSGGMGSVYQMEHQALPRRKAIKVLHPSVQLAEQRQFQQEALAASAVDSEKIVKVDDVGEWADGIRYIVMELIEGRSLGEDLAEKGILPIETTLKLLYRLADTLALVHARGIVHRDLKPQNILLLKDGYIPKLCDFGLASVAAATDDIRVVNTRERTISGSPGYQSPEQLAALPTDGRTDIYSLAVLGFQALTGELPHPPIVRYNPVEAAKFLKRRVPSIVSMRPGSLPPVPSVVENVIGRALAMDVARRYQTAIQFRDDLGRCLSTIGTESGGPARNLMLTLITAEADAGASAPALRTPAGYIDGMISELNFLADEPTIADVTKTKRHKVLPTDSIEVERLGTNSNRAPEGLLSPSEIDALCLLVGQRLGIGAGDEKREAVAAFLHAFAMDTANAVDTDMPFTAFAKLLTECSTEEIILLAGMLRAARGGRLGVREWLMENWR